MRTGFHSQYLMILLLAVTATVTVDASAIEPARTAEVIQMDGVIRPPAVKESLSQPYVIVLHNNRNKDGWAKYRTEFASSDACTAALGNTNELLKALAADQGAGDSANKLPEWHADDAFMKALAELVLNYAGETNTTPDLTAECMPADKAPNKTQ